MVNASEEIGYVIKAAFIRKFPEFISWPDANSPHKEHRANLCMLGSSPVIKHINNIQQQATQAKLALNIITVNGSDFLSKQCHVIFIASSESANVPDYLNKLEGQAIVTISDAANFAQNGGMIGFEAVNDKIRYNVNNKILSKSGLRIDPQLLEIANKVIE